MKRGIKETTERRISATLRLALVAVLFLLNIVAVLLLTSFLSSHSVIALVILEVAAVVMAINIQSKPVGSSYKLAWTLLLVALPVAGLILYVLWSGTYQRRQLPLLPPTSLGISGADERQCAANRERLVSCLPNWRRMADSLRSRGFLVWKDTDVRYLAGGDVFFADVLSHMEKAERFIFLEYFILAEGKLWDRMMEVLAERAAHGVEVKVIFDDFGNITRMHSETIARMREAGMEVQVFNPVHQYVNRLYFNYRDHRKILCIDGQYAYTGGINVADEYAGFIRRFGEWKDSGVCLDGPGTWGLTTAFMQMWEMMGGEMPNEYDYYRALESRAGSGWCQSFTDGPINNPDNPAEDMFLQAISGAKDHIWITTPYFAVDESVVRMLCIAADGGVDVRLMLPGIPDHKYTQMVACSHYDLLLSHGVKLYEFTPGFLHAKSFVADDEVAMVGTVNMDYRSFQLHYECGVVLYGMDAIADIRRDMEAVIKRSTQVELDSWRKRAWWRRILEKLLRVFSIWM